MITHDSLQDTGYCLANSCPLCPVGYETMMHSFTGCDFSQNFCDSLLELRTGMLQLQLRMGLVNFLI